MKVRNPLFRLVWDADALQVLFDHEPGAAFRQLWEKGLRRLSSQEPIQFGIVSWWERYEKPESVMHIFWGTLMAVAGLCMLACGTMKSEAIIYRLMVARSRILWGEGDAVHRFYQVSGLIIIVLGVSCAAGMIWS